MSDKIEDLQDVLGEEDQKIIQQMMPEETDVEKTPVKEEEVVVKKEPVKETPEPTPTPQLSDAEKRIIELQEENARLKATREEKEVEPEKKVDPKAEWKPSFNPSKEDVENLLLGGEEAVKVLNKIRDAFYQDVAALVVPYVQTTVSPFQQYLTQQEYAEHGRKFFEKYPDLKDWEQEVELEAKLIGTNPPKKFKDWDDLYTTVADRVNARVEKYKTKLKPVEVKPVVEKASPPAADKTKARVSTDAGTDEEKLMEAVMRGGY